MQYKVHIKAKSSFTLGWAELWQYRELLFFFAWKEIKVRYKQAVLGIAWTLIQPLAMMTIFVLLLSDGLGLDTGLIPPPLYFLSGLLIWNLFNHTVTNASNAMINNADIIKKIYFPRLIIPLSSALTATFDFIINIGLFIAMILYYSISGKIEISLLNLGYSLIVAYFITIITAFSLGTFLSAINVKYRDIRYVLPFVIQILFFITPVMYDSHNLRNIWAKHIFSYNPLHYAIEIVRHSLSAKLSDIAVIDFQLIIILVLSFCIAIFTFRKTEAYFADIV